MDNERSEKSKKISRRAIIARVSAEVIAVACFVLSAVLISKENYIYGVISGVAGFAAITASALLLKKNQLQQDCVIPDDENDRVE